MDAAQWLLFCFSVVFYSFFVIVVVRFARYVDVRQTQLVRKWARKSTGRAQERPTTARRLTHQAQASPQQRVPEVQHTMHITQSPRTIMRQLLISMAMLRLPVLPAAEMGTGREKQKKLLIMKWTKFFTGQELKVNFKKK